MTDLSTPKKNQQQKMMEWKLSKGERPTPASLTKQEEASLSRGVMSPSYRSFLIEKGVGKPQFSASNNTENPGSLFLFNASRSSNGGRRPLIQKDTNSPLPSNPIAGVTKGKKEKTEVVEKKRKRVETDADRERERLEADLARLEQQVTSTPLAGKPNRQKRARMRKTIKKVKSKLELFAQEKSKTSQENTNTTTTSTTTVVGKESDLNLKPKRNENVDDVNTASFASPQTSRASFAEIANATVFRPDDTANVLGEMAESLNEAQIETECEEIGREILELCNAAVKIQCQARQMLARKEKGELQKTKKEEDEKVDLEMSANMNLLMSKMTSGWAAAAAALSAKQAVLFANAAELSVNESNKKLLSNSTLAENVEEESITETLRSSKSSEEEAVMKNDTVVDKNEKILMKNKGEGKKKKKKKKKVSAFAALLEKQLQAGSSGKTAGKREKSENSNVVRSELSTTHLLRERAPAPKKRRGRTPRGRKMMKDNRETIASSPAPLNQLDSFVKEEMSEAIKDSKTTTTTEQTAMCEASDITPRRQQRRHHRNSTELSPELEGSCQSCVIF
eukprot:g2608.t1